MEGVITCNIEPVQTAAHIWILESVATVAIQPKISYQKEGIKKVPKIAQNAPIAYFLQEARREAGFKSRGTASTAVPFSPESLGRIERQERELPPWDVVALADGYGCQAILIHYCAACPVGIKLNQETAKEPPPLQREPAQTLITSY